MENRLDEARKNFLKANTTLSKKNSEHHSAVVELHTELMELVRELNQRFHRLNPNSETLYSPEVRAIYQKMRIPGF